ncbi:GAF domain-containing protein [Streptomyces sp. GLT-R25]
MGLKVPLGKGPGGSVARHQGPFSAADYLTEYDLDHDPVVYAAARAEGVHAILSVPVWAENEQLGVLGVGNRRVHEFLPDEITLLRSLADIAAVAVKSGRLLAKMRADEPRGELRPPGRFVGSAEPRAARIQRRLLQLALDGAEMNDLLDHCARELGKAPWRCTTGPERSSPRPGPDSHHIQETWSGPRRTATPAVGLSRWQTAPGS